MFVDKETKKERLDICIKCELLQKDIGMCKNCLCIVKFKTKFANEKCPIGKW